MKIPLKWLADYVDCSLPLAQLAERLTLAGLEVGGYRFFGPPIPAGIIVKDDEKGPPWKAETVVVAQIRKVDKHPNADKLKLVELEYGADVPKVVVTGAPNISVGDSGQKVVLGLAGTNYFDGHVSPKQIKELKPGVLRGITSDAMVMSEFELGITDEHEGIILLEDDAPVGMPLVDFMGDVVLEIDVLPNMARCLGLLGVAREVAAITGGRVKLPDLTYFRSAESVDGQVRVSIEDSNLSARYSAKMIRGVTWGPSPGWMKRRLTYAGMRPISNIVDITNYVMLEWGQPLHAFDFDVLMKRVGGSIPHIIVRPARIGEKLVTLDSIERDLNPDFLVIADEAGPIALAGVMGGLDTEVTAATKNILLESASFDYVSIRKTARALNLPSEASHRFSRGVHPEMVRPAAERAAQLLAQYAGGSVLAGTVDCYPSPRPTQVVHLPMTEVRRLLGVDLPIAEVVRILTALDFQTEVAGDEVRATAPTNRLDVQEGAADLIEDVVRLYGYDRLPATLLADALPEQLGNVDLIREERVRDLLVDTGFTEAVTYALTTPSAEQPLSVAGAEYVTLKNPISDDRTVMRRTLAAGLIHIASANLKNLPTVRLFEIGRVFHPKQGSTLPDEPRHLALVMVGRRGSEFWLESAIGPGPMMDFFDLKGAIESLLAELHVAEVVYQQAQSAWLHPGKSVELMVGGQSVGVFGELHPLTAPIFDKDLSDRAVLVAELNLDAILAQLSERHRYVPVAKYPAALRDIALVVPEKLTSERVLAELRAGGGELLRDARLFDVYRGDSIPPGTKSLAFALSYQAADRTLKEKEVDDAHKKIEGRLKHVLKAQIRGT